MPPTPEQSRADLVAMVRYMLDSHGPDRQEGPRVLRLPQDIDPAELAELRAALGQWSGRPRSLALDRFVDPTVTEALGLPLLEPFGDELVELAGWGYRAQWIGLGRIAVGNGSTTQPIVVIAGLWGAITLVPASTWDLEACARSWHARTPWRSA
jgi:hypothetical protein